MIHEMIENASYMAHGYCLLWKPWLVALHAVSDFLIFAAYFAIPVGIWIFVTKRPSVPLQNLAWLFAAFILLCGLTHLINLATLWWPIYETQGVVKLATALVSVFTALAIFPLIPKALAIPSPDELQRANAQLATEIANHEATLAELRAAQAGLQQRFTVQATELNRAWAILEAVNENTPTLIFAKDRDGKITFANKALLGSLGMTEGDLLGKTDADFLADQEQARIIMATDQRVRESGAAELIKESITLADGSTKFYLSTKTPKRDADGNVIGLIGVSFDISDVERLSQALAESEERLRLGAEAAGFGTYDYYPGTRTLRWSARMFDLFALPADLPVTPELFLDLVHPDDRATLGAAARVVAQAEGTTHEQEYRVVLPRGRVRWMLDRSRHVASSGETGAPADRVTGAVVDITERKLAEQRATLLLGETMHRGKNLFTVIQILANRSLSGQRTLAEAREVFTKRLQALAGSLSNLDGDGVIAASLREIVDGELAGFESQADIDGPFVMLNARAAQNFALAVHELSTNASKYGALSVPTGRVAVSWAVVGAGSTARLSFAWRESGGPPVSPPTRKGFGSDLIKVVIAAEFATTVQHEFHPDGLQYGFEAALSLLTPDGPLAS